MSLFPLAVITSLPYIVPFSGYVYGGVVLFNPLVPWWIKWLLFFWSWICSKAVPETQLNIVKEFNDPSPETNPNHVHGAQILLNLLQYPMFIAFIWSFTLSR